MILGTYTAKCGCEWETGTWFPCAAHQTPHANHTAENPAPWCNACAIPLVDLDDCCEADLPHPEFWESCSVNTGIVAWRVGRSGYSTWHLTGDDLWVTLCQLAVPTKPLDRVSRIRGRDKSPTCGRCLHELDKRTAKHLQLVPNGFKERP